MTTITPAVVANGYSMTALTIIRLLGRHEIPVIGLFGNGDRRESTYGFVRASRYLVDRRDFELTHHDTDLLRALTEVGERAPEQYPLFPDSDHSMITLSRNREALGKYFRFALPASEMVERLLDKRAFYDLAQEHDLPVPRTFLPRSSADVAPIASTVKYPCVIKPAWRDKPWSALVGGRDKLIVADSRSVLMRSASVVDPLLGNCLIQEVVPGPEGNILCSFVYLDERSEPLALCQCRKLRQYPLDFGTTSMAEVTWDPEVDSLTRSICSRLKLTGYISIEFKRDLNDGRLKILEITPGRLNRQGAITALAGTNIVYVWYRHLVGDPIKRLGQPITPTKWISEVNELRSVPRYLQQRRLSPRQILASYRRLKGLEIVSVRDPVPTLLCASTALRAAGENLWRRALFSSIPKSV